jgi:hypothetical protein
VKLYWNPSDNLLYFEQTMAIDEMLTETSRKFNQGFNNSVTLPMAWPWQANKHSITIRDIHAAQTEENLLVMKGQQQRGVSDLPNEDTAGGRQSATAETQLRNR